MSVNDNSLKSLWQALPSESVVFTSEQMRSRATQFQAKHKRRDMIEYAGIPLLLGLIAYTLTVQSDWQEWVASGLAIIGAIIMMWNYIRLAKVQSVPSLKSGIDTVEFMRRELTRQRDAAATAWRWYILPFIPFLIFVFVYRWIQEGSTLTERTDMRISLLLLIALIIAYCSATIFWHFLKAARYQRQLDGLDSYRQ